MEARLNTDGPKLFESWYSAIENVCSPYGAGGISGADCMPFSLGLDCAEEEGILLSGVAGLRLGEGDGPCPTLLLVDSAETEWVRILECLEAALRMYE